ncbi:MULTISPECIES: late competence development ComFB family protein [Arthrospira]|nr:MULTISPECIES: late competence development ComFB family protein [Arthrospira]MDF2208907.1 late competence development ComFB family protein [Arthrospira platensis NCB002]MDT9182953.1 late competence development ComFB family protein [Limnospira sp. PMC 289.06]MDT9295132.1 late competence development ComFB family protein [Arthrospira platensis PCC 7345]MDT9310665.1 late competence development ComFB family protein [Limnospira sp. Paracas R14]
MATIKSRKYHNVMEDLVSEEVRRQLVSMSPRLTQYIKRVEVETYALNRLPPLYACSREGWLHQKRRGTEDCYEQVKIAVRQALAAVQRDLLRNSTPLVGDEEEHKTATTATHPVTKGSKDPEQYKYLRKSNSYYNR